MSRSVLVTGGNRGIGLAIAQQFAAAGDRVAVTYHHSPPPDGLLAVKCDVSSSVDVDRAFGEVEAAHGPVQVLVTAAGITRDSTIRRATDDDIAAVIGTNLVGPIYAARRAVPNMHAKKFGRIIFLSSVVAELGAAGQTTYAAAKAGLKGAARSLARELGPRGITVNVVAPGLTDTEMIRTIPEAIMQRMVDTIPVGRINAPDDVARMVLFLAADEQGTTNGGFFPIDGGAATGH
ncbi:SDR family oxidoreductase [Catellatospora methionotrophica]|uniref:SDR family oxidoreductase n=1 Tax=Catellatospora methionotrophica TaxID=121620 RepID=UPI0033E7E46C